MNVDTSGFHVDLAARRVTHVSGAAATFYEYPSEDEWRASDVVTLLNPRLYDGPEVEFARLAKEAALKAGMTRCTP